MKTRLFALLGLLFAFPAHAADNPQQNAVTFRPSAHPSTILGVDTAHAVAPWQLHAGAWLSYSHWPVKITDVESGAQVLLVGHQMGADVALGLGLWQGWSVALAVPLYHIAGDALPGELKLNQVGGSSLGDVRFGVRGVLIDSKGAGLGVAVAAETSVPTATRADFSGDQGTTATARAIVDYATDSFRVALNAGVRRRAQVSVLGQPFGNELHYGAAAAVPVPGMAGKVQAVGSVTGWTPSSDAFATGVTIVDAIGGAKMQFGDVAVTAAAGGGLASGFGSPAFRAVVGVAYAPLSLGDWGYTAPGAPRAFACPGHPEVTDPAACGDSDADGVVDLDDRCPTATGAATARGCPDSDNDGVANLDDRCPRHPGGAATQGCPDADADSVGDDMDECPGAKGPAVTKGCPDSDGDGIADNLDKCPQVPGTADGKGCPTDRDGDGVPDASDKCPDAPGTAAKNGCPEQRVTVTKEKIVLAEKVFFELGAAAIDKKSHGLLDDIAAILKKNPQVTRVRIEGHTDNAGVPEENRVLSEKRAQAVKKYLVGKGIAEKRLVAVGLGDTKPVADNATEEGKASNRRVELLIDEGGK